MAPSAESLTGVVPTGSGGLYAGTLAVAVGILFFAFWSGLTEMERVWGLPEYSHGYLIPFLSLYVLSVRLSDLRRSGIAESWLGVVVMAIGLMAFVFGELSAIYAIVQYAFLIVLWGLVLTVIGRRGFRVIWASMAFLIFLVPLPNFIQFNLSTSLQLVSSELGTSMLRMMGAAVFLEGNVIDLGIYKLQVVEACSGLRYLFPLMSFGFLCAVLFRGPVWQRWFIFLSSLPITIVMNSFRIAVTGLLVNRFGIQAAEGFLHYFEGWVIFTACLVIMFAEMAVLAKVAGRRLDDVFDLEVPSIDSFRGWFAGRVVGRHLSAAVVLLLLGAAASVFLAGRTEQVPAHVSLSTFPLLIGEWRGQERSLGTDELDVLKLTDYALVDYVNPVQAGVVQLYVAYYESQRKGTSAHSPRACLPGGGWKFDEFSQAEIPNIQANGESVPVNRVLMSQGESRQLVYYWFMQRGRNVTNEYMTKWYIFSDSITKQRTDGALLRLVTPVGDVTEIEAADARLGQFLRDAYPSLYFHIPQDKAVSAVIVPTDN